MSTQDPPRKPFNINQQQGAQADAVRSKIASLMDGATARDEQQPQQSQASQTAPAASHSIQAAPEPARSPKVVGDIGPVTSAPPSALSGVMNKGVNMAGHGNEADLTPEPSESIGEPLPGAVNIRGRSGGVLVEIGKGNWAELMLVLTDRLARSANFFRNGKVALDLGPRVLTEQDLRHLYHLLAQHHLTLGLIRTSSSDTFQLALALGLAAHLDQPESKVVTTAQPALSNIMEEHHFVYSGHLRAGQVLRRQEHVLIIGDVNPGATVISDGDILIWGRLRGVAHAGASGDMRAVIVALDLSPVQLRIHEVLAIAPEAQPARGWRRWRRPSAKQPEIAYLAGNEIVVDAWDATKFGGIATLRR